MDRILIGKGEQPVHLLARYGNRHGLVAGATGTGKTISLMVLAEGFSRLGVPVFMADVKGDVAGLAMAAAIILLGFDNLFINIVLGSAIYFAVLVLFKGVSFHKGQLPHLNV